MATTIGLMLSKIIIVLPRRLQLTWGYNYRMGCFALVEHWLKPSPNDVWWGTRPRPNAIQALSCSPCTSQAGSTWGYNCGSTPALPQTGGSISLPHFTMYYMTCALCAVNIKGRWQWTKIISSSLHIQKVVIFTVSLSKHNSIITVWY